MSGKPLDIKGIVAMIIAATFGIMLCTTVLGALLTGRALTPETSHTIAAISGALIGVLSTYIGGKVSDSSSAPPT